MADYNEIEFEREICEYMAAGGWLYSENDSGYDRERVLFPEDLFLWLAETQPEELAKVVDPNSPRTEQQKEQLLDRLVKALDNPLESGGGTLNILRNGFSHLSAKFAMCQFRPETGLNDAVLDAYDANRVRIMRQVHFSTQDQRSIDLVAFVNGLPVLTIELKTDFTQTVHDAMRQYKTDRKPRGGDGHVEPLLSFGHRALVHFAASNDEVWMTTRLSGEKTWFLPFNKGRDQGAGNPINPNGSATSYLWEEVLTRDSLLDILHRFLHLEVTKSRDPISGQVKTSTVLLFPRYHQWDAVTKLTDAAKIEGPGQRYLIQHSAGSGKTNSIAWTAHRLARLHDFDSKKIFDSVIVVTDRNVLDAQLREAIKQIDGDIGLVAAIDKDEVAKSGTRSKSGLLAKSLAEGKLIIVVTLQTFPYAMKEIQESKALKGKSFAVIADEAHSSQSGKTAGELKSMLSAEQQEMLDRDGEVEVSTDEILAVQTAARASAGNISFFAFTATPKPKTLELFGRDDANGVPEPFHLYSMKQAIEEGFILDVLRGYTTYTTAFALHENGEKSEVVDEAAATKQVLRWVKLHPTNIGQKAKLIVEHFRENVIDELDGHAKAMVVADSRKAAVRFKDAIDKYVTEQGYSIGALVAFSGSLEDLEVSPEPLTEARANPGTKGQDLRSAFVGPAFQIMVVANKFQTGFDQPLLSAMYVDKRLSGVAAVQTLSRLNRTYVTPSGNPKQKTLILDFVNEADDIQKAFEPYFVDAKIEERTDPNLVHDLAAKLDLAGIYTREEVEALADAWVAHKGNNALAGLIAPAKARFRDQYLAAKETENKEQINRLDLFRKDVGSYVRLYDFVSQILDFADPYLEKLAIFLMLLERQIRPESVAEEVDVSKLVLNRVEHKETGTTDIKLAGDEALKPMTEVGTGQKRDKKMVAFGEIIDRLNEIFGEQLTLDQEETFLTGLIKTVLADPKVKAQAGANTESQFLESPDLIHAILAAVDDNQQAHELLADFFYRESADREDLISRIGALIHQHAAESEADA